MDVMEAAYRYAGGGDLIVGMGNIRGAGATLLAVWRTIGEEVVIRDG